MKMEITKAWLERMALFEGDQEIGAGLLARDPFPAVSGPHGETDMTTSVTVKTHSWPVEIITTDTYGDRDATETKETVAPNSERQVYLTQNRTLSFREMPLPEQPA